MKLLTKAFSHLNSKRYKEIDTFIEKPEETQRLTLASLIGWAAHTEWGKKYHYDEIKDYATFAQRVPIQQYDDIKPYVERMLKNEGNLICPSKVKWFAKSSGTTNDKSKFIPVTEESLRNCHYKGGFDSVLLYLRNNPESEFFSGKGLILGGSHAPSAYGDSIQVGDLSAVLIENLSPFVNFIRVPNREIILMSEWESKLKAIVENTIDENVTNLSGVPSWMLVLIKAVLQKTGKQYLTDVWPNLEVFFHGGISFAPYREQYKSLIPTDRMHYEETYNASEGFFAIQNDLNDPGMLLMLDYNVFYEFIPMEEIENEQPKAIPLWEVETGKNYAMVITTDGGLWRYLIGDTVKFTSTSPYKIVITGRTKHFINAFGEELMVANADKAIAEACKATGAKVKEYTAAPLFYLDIGKGRHQWLFEFEKQPQSIDAFTDAFDTALKGVNSDYEAKRYKDFTLLKPEVNVAREGLFYEWMAQRGKLGGQHKVPRLSNSREYIDKLLEMNGTKQEQ